jgi:hypothetical protein
MIDTQPGLARKLAVAASLLALAPAALEAQGAGNGQMGPTSHASARISVSVMPSFVPQQREFARAQDGAGAPRGLGERLCISSNAQAGSFRVTAFEAAREDAAPSDARSRGRNHLVESQRPDARSAAPLAAALLNGSLDTVALCNAQRSAAAVVLRQALGSNHVSFGSQARTVLLLIAPD